MSRLVFAVEGEPLGVNRLYRSVAGRSIKSREGRAYSAHFVACAVRARLAAGGGAALEAPVAVTLRIFFGSERPDIDGPIKIALDSMECATPRRDGAGIYRNDRLVRRLVVERHVDRERPRVEVVVEPLAPLDLASRVPEKTRRDLGALARALNPKAAMRPSVRRFAP